MRVQKAVGLLDQDSSSTSTVGTTELLLAEDQRLEAVDFYRQLREAHSTELSLIAWLLICWLLKGY